MAAFILVILFPSIETISFQTLCKLPHVFWNFPVRIKTVLYFMWMNFSLIPHGSCLMCSLYDPKLMNIWKELHETILSYSFLGMFLSWTLVYKIQKPFSPCILISTPSHLRVYQNLGSSSLNCDLEVFWRY